MHQAFELNLQYILYRHYEYLTRDWQQLFASQVNELLIIFVDHKIYTCKQHWTYKNKNIYIKNYRRKKNKPYCSSQQIGYMKTTVHKNNWYRRWKKIKIFIKLLFSCQFLKKTYIKKKVVHRIFYYIYNRTNWRFNNAKVHISSETFLLPNIEAVAQRCPVKKVGQLY